MLTMGYIPSRCWSASDETATVRRHRKHTGFNIPSPGTLGRGSERFSSRHWARRRLISILAGEVERLHRDAYDVESNEMERGLDGAIADGFAFSERQSIKLAGTRVPARIREAN